MLDLLAKPSDFGMCGLKHAACTPTGIPKRPRAFLHIHHLPFTHALCLTADHHDRQDKPTLYTRHLPSNVKFGKEQLTKPTL